MQVKITQQLDGTLFILHNVKEIKINNQEIKCSMVDLDSPTHYSWFTFKFSKVEIQ